jgi:hypothetical protein
VFKATFNNRSCQICWWRKQGLLKKNKKKLARSFNFKFSILMMFFHYITRFGDFVDCIYPIELQLKDTTDTDWSASYLDLHLEIHSEGLLKTKFMTKEMISICPS